MGFGMIGLLRDFGDEGRNECKMWLYSTSTRSIWRQWVMTSSWTEERLIAEHAQNL